MTTHEGARLVRGTSARLGLGRNAHELRRMRFDRRRSAMWKAGITRLAIRAGEGSEGITKCRRELIYGGTLIAAKVLERLHAYAHHSNVCRF